MIAPRRTGEGYAGKTGFRYGNYPPSALFHDRHLSQIKAGPRGRLTKAGMWQPIRTAPFDTEIELAVIDREGPHGLVFPCRRALRGWIKAETGESIAVRPTHWKPWNRLEAETGATPR